MENERRELKRLRKRRGVWSDAYCERAKTEEADERRTDNATVEVSAVLLTGVMAMVIIGLLSPPLKCTLPQLTRTMWRSMAHRNLVFLDSPFGFVIDKSCGCLVYCCVIERAKKSHSSTSWPLLSSTCDTTSLPCSGVVRTIPPFLWVIELVCIESGG